MIAFNSGTNDAYWDSDWRIPKTYNIAEEICHKHATRKEKVALFYEDEEGNKEECSFYEIKSLSDKFAHVLCGLGLKRGDRVAIMLPQRPENVISHLGVLKMGAVSVPLSTLYGKDTLNHCLRNCRPKAIVIETKERRRISRISKKLKELVNVIVVGEEYKDELGFKREVRQAARGFRGVSTKANDAAMIFYTSGTTGLPRGVLHAHRFLIGRLPGFSTCP